MVSVAVPPFLWPPSGPLCNTPRQGWGMEGRLNDLSGQSPPYCPILTTK